MPEITKPVKIIYEDYPCPLIPERRCPHSDCINETDDGAEVTMKLTCSKFGSEECKIESRTIGVWKEE